MSWSSKLTELNEVLAELVPHPDSITKFVKGAGLKPSYIKMTGSAIDVWSEVISEADRHGKVDDLISAVLQVYSSDPFLLSALSSEAIANPLSPDIDAVSTWRGAEIKTLEKLTQGINTMLPVSFLAQGIVCSKSVAKVQVKKGAKIIVGTGFLCKIGDSDKSYFITNFHVLDDPKLVDEISIIFNFETDINGDTMQSETFKVDSSVEWIFSTTENLDFTAIRLIDHEKAVSCYGCLLLKDLPVERDDFVNIIQHPAGQMKQIALYHNIVTYSDDKIVQYLTDTLNGSSGSPVFNSSWDVVALHHSGGRQKENDHPLPVDANYRNEGVRISAIIKLFNNQ